MPTSPAKPPALDESDIEYLVSCLAKAPSAVVPVADLPELFVCVRLTPPPRVDLHYRRVTVETGYPNAST